jgi:CelD/BcsL family acetyltransferase involved in cellulose biosynthesis
MDVFRLTALDELSAYAESWDRLARGVPFRSWAWMSHWWRHYASRDDARGRMRLFALCVFDRGDELAGVAPWYLETSAAQGRVLRFLGSGEVCPDYLSVLCAPGAEDRVGEALAKWLVGRSASHEEDAWDLLELAGVDAEDTAVARLAGHLAARGAAVHRRPGPNCWRIELPGDWRSYLAMLSRRHRGQIGRIERRLKDTGRAVLHTVERLEDLPRATEVLVDLHQRRWRARGLPGCFASARFTAFHRDLIPALLVAGQLQLHWVELDGRPVAAEYHMAGDGVIYAYQSGIDPQAVAESPGELAHALTVRRAIENGHRAIDFLRGDEPYKAHWRARPHPGVEFRIVPARISAQLRHGLRAARENVKEWIKTSLKMVGLRGEG